MDNLLDYRNVLQTGAEETKEAKQTAEEKLDSLKQRIESITAGFEGPGMEALNRLSVGSLKALGKRLNLPVEKALQVKDAFKKDGYRGVVRVFKQNPLGGSKPDIASLSPSEFREGFSSIKEALDARTAQLSPEKQTAFFDNVRPNLKTKAELPDDFERYQNNLHEAAKGLDELEGDQPIKSKLVSSILRTSPDDEIQGGLKSATQVFKSKAENVGSKIVSNLKKSGEDMIKTDVEGGGPEDFIGDAIGAVVGIGTFLGGLIGARHLKAPPSQVISSTYQLGA